MFDSIDYDARMTDKAMAAFLNNDVPNKYRDGFYLKHPFGYQNPKVYFDLDKRTIRLGGSLVKLLQGHNVYGSNNAEYLCLMATGLIYRQIGVEFSAEEIAEIKENRIRLHRADVACSFLSESQALVPAALDALSNRFQAEGRPWSAYGKNGVESVYLRIRSKRVAVKFYNKHLELKAHPLSNFVIERDLIQSHAERILRFEITYRAEELKRLGLNYADCWSPELVRQTLQRRLAKLKLIDPVDPSKAMPSVPVKAPIEFYLSLWESGTDFRGKVGYAPFARAREQLLKQGIDILIPKERTPVISIQEMLSNGRVYFGAPKGLIRRGLIAGADN